MIILNAISTAQEITSYVRSHVGVQYMILVTNEESTIETSSIVSGSYSDGVLTINVTHDFQEGRFYMIHIFSLLGGTEYEAHILRVAKDSGTSEANACLNYDIAELMAFDAEALLVSSKVYVTDQTDLDKYSVLNSYYTQIEKTETTYIVKP